MCQRYFPNFVMLNKKATGPKSLQVNYWKINQITSIYQMNFLDKTCKKMFKSRKSEHPHLMLHIKISQSTKFQLKLAILNFRTKLTQEGCFQSKKEKNEINHVILNIRISLGSKLQLQQFEFFGTNFPPKRYL